MGTRPALDNGFVKDLRRGCVCPPAGHYTPPRLQVHSPAGPPIALTAMAGKVLGTAVLVGLYRRL